MYGLVVLGSILESISVLQSSGKIVYLTFVVVPELGATS